MFPNLLVVLVLILLGWAAGAVVNYLADVLPYRRRLAAPFCLECQATLSLSNYLVWPRRCPKCNRRRTLRTWIVEGIAILATIWLWLYPPGILGFAWGLVLLVYFGTVVVIDLEYRLILHPVSLFGVALGLGIGIAARGVVPTILGGLVGFGSMFIFYLLGEGLVRLIYRLRGQKLDEVALGFGDVNLSAVLGLMLGWPAILSGLFLAILLGGAFSLVYMLGMLVTRRYHLFSAIPYGPFLVSAAVILIYFRDQLVASIPP